MLSSRGKPTKRRFRPTLASGKKPSAMRRCASTCRRMSRHRPDGPSRVRARSAFFPELTQHVYGLGRSLGSTSFLTLLTAFELLLSWEAGTDDIVLGTNDANRKRLEFENMIGNLSELVVLRSRLGPARTFADAHRIVRAAFVAAQSHGSVRFDQIIEAIGPSHRMGETPWVNVIFSHLDAEKADIAFPGLEVRTREVSNDTAKFDLTLTTAETDGRLLATLEHRSDRFRRKPPNGFS